LLGNVVVKHLFSIALVIDNLMSIFGLESSGNLVFYVIFDANFLLLYDFIFELKLVYKLIQFWYFNLEVSSLIGFFICQIVILVWLFQDLRY